MESYPANHNTKWSSQEFKLLLKEIKNGFDFEKIAKIHKRTINGIKYKLIRYAVELAEEDQTLNIKDLCNITSLSREDLIKGFEKIHYDYKYLDNESDEDDDTSDSDYYPDTDTETESEVSDEDNDKNSEKNDNYEETKNYIFDSIELINKKITFTCQIAIFMATLQIGLYIYNNRNNLYNILNFK